MSTLDGMPANTFVVSFSEDGNLLSQWRGYCPAGGYCLTFDPQALKQLADSQIFVFVKCSYDRAEQEDLVRELVDAALLEFPSWTPPPHFPSNADLNSRLHWFPGIWFFPKMLRLGSAMKDPAFSEEREWRLIGGLYKPPPPVHVRARGSLLIPYQVLCLDKDRPFEGVLAKITVGPSQDQELAEFGVGRLLSMRPAGAISIERSSIPYRTTSA